MLLIQNWLEKYVMMKMHYTTSRMKTLCHKNYWYYVSKTIEMFTDFRKKQRCPKAVYIKGEAVERVDPNSYLVVVFDRRLN